MLGLLAQLQQDTKGIIMDIFLLVQIVIEILCAGPEFG